MHNSIEWLYSLHQSMVFLCKGREVSEAGKGGGRGNQYKSCNILYYRGFPVFAKVCYSYQLVNTALSYVY